MKKKFRVGSTITALECLFYNDGKLAFAKGKDYKILSRDNEYNGFILIDETNTQHTVNEDWIYKFEICSGKNIRRKSIKDESKTF